MTVDSLGSENLAVELSGRSAKAPYTDGKAVGAAHGVLSPLALPASHPLVARRRQHLALYLLQLSVKRVVDVALALALLVALLPLLLVVIAAIKWDSPGPLFYNRARVGKRGRPFTMYKFRTMTSDAEQRLRGLQHLNAGGAHMVKIKNDPRVTRVGRVLRASSIDEVPQLLNVLKGEMSIIGPRPQTPAEVALYTDEQRLRLLVLPGITGLWQVKDRHNPSFEQWITWDLHYIATWSLWLDLCIAWQTVVMIIVDIRRAAFRALASR